MSKKIISLKDFDVNSFVLLTLYLLIGFIPNLDAVDKIAPQWLFMSILNFISIAYIILKRKIYFKSFSQILNSKLSLIYIGFILWAGASYFYAINSTEVLVNISRQANVLLMYIVMGAFLFSFPKYKKLIPSILSIILFIEIYAVITQAHEMINSFGTVYSGELKGLTANRNITAFSIAIKIPFIIYLIHFSQKRILKFSLTILVFTSLLSLTLIQSRASFIAIGLILLSYLAITIHQYLNSKNLKDLLKFGFLLIPFCCSVFLNQIYYSSKGADALNRASTISLNTNDGSVNQRLRYYKDVFTHVKSNPMFGVGLGNWKLKSIEYDSKDIEGYVVPYHAHSDFIQLGAELGIFGFFLYLGIFGIALYYVWILLRDKKLVFEKKIFFIFLTTSLGVYSIDANLNFPIARPQILIVWTLIIAIIVSSYQHTLTKPKIIKKINLYAFLFFGIAVLIPSIYINNQVYKSLKGQMILLQDFNSNAYNLPLKKVYEIVPDIPNITVTTIPIKSVKARYYVKAKMYDKALELIDQGTIANPFLYYSELLKSQIYQEQNKIDSAFLYAKKAFYGLPNNLMHSTNYIKLIDITRNQDALEEAFDLLTEKNNIINWKNYLKLALSFNDKDMDLILSRAKQAKNLFSSDKEIDEIFQRLSLTDEEINSAIKFSKIGLDFYNKQDFFNAAESFEKAIKYNPLDYSHYENASIANLFLGNLDEALDQIDIVVNQLNPNNGKCEYIKALILIRKNDLSKVCELLKISFDLGFDQAKKNLNEYCN